MAKQANGLAAAAVQCPQSAKVVVARHVGKSRPAAFLRQGTRMRDKRFVAVHRGGKLSRDNHHKLMKWARHCFERALAYYSTELDESLKTAIQIAGDWQDGKCSTADAIKASRKAHKFAKTISEPVSCAVARAVGQGVATPHMADHCMGAALYAQKAVKLAGKSVKEEKHLQIRQLADLPDELAELIKGTLELKAKRFGL
jgi:hypothetical protein